MLITNNVN